MTPSNVSVRGAIAQDEGVVLALNDADVAFTSAMDRSRLALLAGMSWHYRVACRDEQVVGFLLAMRNGAPYENDNFAWFSARFPSFVYVDRIVVSSKARGLRVGSLLYEDLFGRAKREAIPLVTCEYNIEPPNEPSRLFHDKFGFIEQGRQWVSNGTKRVSLQAART